MPFSLPCEPRADLRWSPGTLGRHTWLSGLLSVPDDASPPSYMSPVPGDAVGSYGAQAVEWIERTQGLTLRWWQRLAIVRQLEHRADGSLVHGVVLESTPRRAGKSVRLRGLALWRMAHAELFGEVQTVVHTGSDVAICREIQRGAWRWAEDVAGWRVARANGKECIESTTGDRWLVRSQSAVYGYDVSLGMIDEAWDVHPQTLSEGLEPATLERFWPQVHLTSTAHRRATSLMRSRLALALTTDDPGTLLMLWAAPSDADPGDEAVWRAASPHWTEDRRAMIASKYEAAAAGDLDPQADDAAPMAGFTSQYLNTWRLGGAVVQRGEAIVTGPEWAALAVPDEVPLAAPDAAAIESWFGPSSLALAWRVGARVVVSVSGHPDLVSAAAGLRESGFTGHALVGASLISDAALAGLAVRKGEGRTITAAQTVRRLVTEDVLRHDGSDHLTGQLLGLRTVPAAEGPRMASKGRADAVKAAVWAVESLRSGAAVGRPRILLPSA